MKIQAKKSLGQNFLSNPRILDKIIATAEVSKEDIVLEVGPGTGNLTRKLAENSKKVIAIEKDVRLIDFLKENFRNSNVEIIEGDVLGLNPTDFNLQPPYKIVANIPYYITSNFLRIIFEKWPKPELIVLMVQKEVALRIIAKPPHMNLLALSVQYYAEPKIAGYISKNNFNPPPKIDSAIIRLKPKVLILMPEKTERIFELMKAGFGEKRKQLLPVLSKKLNIAKEVLLRAFKETGLNEKIRAENLSLEQWEKLENYLHT